MKYARCKTCRSELVKLFQQEWQHVYARANPDCILEVDKESIVDVEKW